MFSSSELSWPFWVFVNAQGAFIQQYTVYMLIRNLAVIKVSFMDVCGIRHEEIISFLYYCPHINAVEGVSFRVISWISGKSCLHIH